MNIKILKHTPYMRDYEREIKPGEIHKVKRIGFTLGMHPNHDKYYFNVDGRERMVLNTDCIVLLEPLMDNK